MIRSFEAVPFIKNLVKTSHTLTIQMLFEGEMFWCQYAGDIPLVAFITHFYELVPYFAVYNAYFLPKFLREK